MERIDFTGACIWKNINIKQYIAYVISGQNVIVSNIWCLMLNGPNEDNIAPHTRIARKVLFVWVNHFVETLGWILPYPMRWFNYRIFTVIYPGIYPLPVQGIKKMILAVSFPIMNIIYISDLLEATLSASVHWYRLGSSDPSDLEVTDTWPRNSWVTRAENATIAFMCVSTTGVQRHQRRRLIAGIPLILSGHISYTTYILSIAPLWTVYMLYMKYEPRV